MSLLLEALKKAERAKEEAQRRARGEAPGSGEIAFVETPADKQVTTRDQLPDISVPLEIRSDDIASAPAAEPALRPAPSAPAPAPAAAPQRKPAAPQPEPQSAERAAAKKVFEAKFREPNPRLPFFIAMGLLGAFAVGTAGYFWYQLRPPPSLVNANPQRPVDEKPAAVAEQPAPVTAPAAPTTASAPQPAIPGSPPAPPAAAPSAQHATVPPPAPAATPAVGVAAAPKAPAVPPVAPVTVARAAPPAKPAAPRAVPAAEANARTSSDSVSFSRPTPQIHPRVEAAYAAYTSGDMPAARTGYEAALREQPGNRDALLGLAAVDVRTGRLEAAEATYLRLLQADPRDAHAQAGLIALRSGRMDPVVAESRVKTLLSAEPDAHVLYFTLGNQLAQQGRWGEAQQHYFKAFSAEPDNADFAYNLAVSLDQLRQPKLALDYYRRALLLAEKRGASFDAEAARGRVAQLAR